MQVKMLALQRFRQAPAEYQSFGHFSFMGFNFVNVRLGESFFPATHKPTI